MARNRNRDVGIDQGINRIVEGTLVEGAIRSEGSTRIDGCLLYTSDAADE